MQHSLFCGTCLVYDMTAEREFLKASSSLDYIHVEQWLWEGSVIMRQIESVKKEG